MTDQEPGYSGGRKYNSGYGGQRPSRTGLLSQM